MLANKYFKQGKEFLGVDYPVICGAMTWVSDPELVSTVSNSGGFGVLAGGNLAVDVLEEQIGETRGKTEHPFGVNLITVAPNYQDHIELVREKEVPFVIFAGSFPRKREIQRVKESGAKVLCFASTSSIAERMLKYGTDAIILEGMEAGGHVGKVSLVVLLQQVLFSIDENVPVFIGGGITTGKLSAHLLMMGGAGIQMGTKFAVAKESKVHRKFKEKIFNAKARNAVSTPQFDSRLPVVAVRSLHNQAHEKFNQLQLDLLKSLDNDEITRSEAQQKVEEFWVGALKEAALEGNVEEGSLMAGQSAGLVNKEISVSAIIDEMVAEIEKELQRNKKNLNGLGN